MSASSDRELLLAILAIDSYNQGYDAGLKHGATRIGSASLHTDSSIKLGEEGTKSAGFYASAYKLGDGSTVISFRGTDRLVGDGNNRIEQVVRGDIWNGWVGGAGFNTAFTARTSTASWCRRHLVRIVKRNRDNRSKARPACRAARGHARWCVSWRHRDCSVDRHQTGARGSCRH